MATNIENLEFQEISKISVTEAKEGFHVIGFDSEGTGKAYPLDNFNTKDKVDNKLKNKVNVKELDAAKKDINTLELQKADKTELTTIKSDVEGLEASKLGKSEFENYKIKNGHDKGYFSTEAALKAAYPSPIAGDNANVSGIIYECKSPGSWTNTGQAATTPSLDLSEYAKNTGLDILTSKIDYGYFDLENMNKYPSLAGITDLKMPV